MEGTEFRRTLFELIRKTRHAAREAWSFVAEPWMGTAHLLIEHREPLRKVPKKVFLIRHPHTNEEVDKIYRGDHAEITEKGWEEARVVANRLAEFGITHIVTSTLPRSQQLAEIIAVRCTVGKLPVEYPTITPSSLFVECRKPSFMTDRHRRDSESERVMRRIRKWFDLHYRHSDEENRWRLELRAWRALRLLADLDAECVVVVTHGKFLRILIHYLYEGGTLRRFYAKADRLLKLDHTGITKFSLEPSYRTGTVQWNIEYINDVAHTDEFVPQEVMSALARIA